MQLTRGYIGCSIVTTGPDNYQDQQLQQWGQAQQQNSGSADDAIMNPLRTWVYDPYGMEDGVVLIVDPDAAAFAAKVSSTVLVTGIDSPVTMDSSTSDWPSSTTARTYMPGSSRALADTLSAMARNCASSRLRQCAWTAAIPVCVTNNGCERSCTSTATSTSARRGPKRPRRSIARGW